MSKLKYGMAIASSIAAFVAVAGPPVPQTVANDQIISQATWITDRAKTEYAIQEQECGTLKNSQPQAYEPCLQKAQSTRDNLLTQMQGSGQGSQGVGFNQSQQQYSRQEEQGPIDRMTSAVKETVAEVKEKLFGSSDAGQQRSQGQSMGPGQQGSVIQGQHPLQQGFEARQMQGQGSGQGGQSFSQQGNQDQQFAGQQGQSGRGSFQGGQQPQGQSGQGSFQGGQPEGQSGQGSFQGGQQPQGQSGQGSFQQPQGQSGQGSFQGGQQPQGQSWQQGTGGNNQQFQGQQGQSGQGSLEGGNFGQQPQGQSGQHGMGGTNQQFQSGGTQGFQGSSNVQGGLTSGSAGEHMDRAEYYQGLAHQQYETLKQECKRLDPSVYEQCLQYAQSTRDKIAAMAEQGT